MHAILITTDNLPKIDQFVHEGTADRVTIDYLLKVTSRWYAIRDYVSIDGIFFKNAILPAFVIETTFLVDKGVAEHDWDTIYRLP